LANFDNLLVAIMMPIIYLSRGKGELGCAGNKQINPMIRKFILIRHDDSQYPKIGPSGNISEEIGKSNI
jgi:hypothetical protein